MLVKGDKIKFSRTSAKKKLKFKYVAQNKPSFYFVSHPESGQIVHKAQLTDSFEHEILVEHMERGIYNLIIVDGDDLIKQQFEKI